MPPKAKGRRARELVTPLSGLNVDKLLEKKPKISIENAIPEFKQMMASANEVGVSAFGNAAKGMSSVIRTLVKDSFASNNYGQALANLAVMKEELTVIEEPELYNDFLRDFKKQLLGEELGGKRKDFFWELRKAKLGLIDQSKTEMSDVTDEMATEVRTSLY